MHFQIHLVYNIGYSLVEHDRPLVGFTKCLAPVHGFKEFAFAEDAECRPGDTIELDQICSSAPPCIYPAPRGSPYKIVGGELVEMR